MTSITSCKQQETHSRPTEIPTIVAKVYFPEFLDPAVKNYNEKSNIANPNLSPITSMNITLDSGFSVVKQVDGEIRRVVVSNKSFEQFKSIASQSISIPILDLSELRMDSKMNVEYMIDNLSETNNYDKWCKCNGEKDWNEMIQKYLDESTLKQTNSKKVIYVIRIRLTVEYVDKELCERNRSRKSSSRENSSKSLIDSLYSQMCGVLENNRNNVQVR